MGSFEENWVYDPMTGEPHERIPKHKGKRLIALSTAVLLRDRIEYAQAYNESIEQSEILEEIDKIINLLQSST